MKILVISSELKQKHIDKISDKARTINAEVSFTDSEDRIPKGFEEPDIVYGYGINLARTCRELKWLCVPSAGVDYLMKPGTFANEGCILSNSSGAYGVTIAEHIIAVALMMMRRLTYYYKESLDGLWGQVHYPQKSLIGSRITVLGTGDIGCTFARRVRSFEPEKIVGVNRSGELEDNVFDSIYKVDVLDSILPETDLLVMSLPATPDTTDILSRDRIKLLPHGAFIVNVGRGSAVDEEALADYLDDDYLGGAALDVFRTEPLPKDSRLWKTRNLIITPHVAGNFTVEYTLDKNVDMFLEDLGNFAKGYPLKYSVDRKKGY